MIYYACSYDQLCLIVVYLLHYKAFSVRPKLTEFTPGDKNNFILVIGVSTQSSKEFFSSELQSKENTFSCCSSTRVHRDVGYEMEAGAGRTGNEASVAPYIALVCEVTLTSLLSS